MSFHVRGYMPQKEVVKGTNRASKQDKMVLDYLELHPKDKTYSAEEISDYTGIRVESVRRSLTNLKVAGKAIKHEDIRKPGRFDSTVCTWSLAKSQTELF